MPKKLKKGLHSLYYLFSNYFLLLIPYKKIRYIIAVDDEDVRESFLKDVNILMKVFIFFFHFIFF